MRYRIPTVKGKSRPDKNMQDISGYRNQGKNSAESQKKRAVISKKVALSEGMTKTRIGSTDPDWVPKTRITTDRQIGGFAH
uniref:Uncharacterized protein n=1 Tax=Romanomermis culicivorax TaxID=13658 RepID=A0A915KUK2_ROMCU